MYFSSDFGWICGSTVGSTAAIGFGKSLAVLYYKLGRVRPKKHNTTKTAEQSSPVSHQSSQPPTYADLDLGESTVSVPLPTYEQLYNSSSDLPKYEDAVRWT